MATWHMPCKLIQQARLAIKDSDAAHPIDLCAEPLPAFRRQSRFTLPAVMRLPRWRRFFCLPRHPPTPLCTSCASEPIALSSNEHAPLCRYDATPGVRMIFMESRSRSGFLGGVLGALLAVVCAHNAAAQVA